MTELERARAVLLKFAGGVGRSRPAGVALIVLAAGLVWIPFVARGISCGHDFDFHFESWFEIARAWRSGMIYPHWADSPNWGAGEPRFVFYPPLTWILGAALGMGLSWVLATPLLIWILLAATGLSVRALAREWFAEGTATLAGAIAIFSGYTLFNAFERSAFSELAGGALIPLVILFAQRQRNAGAEKTAAKVFDGSTLPLTLVIALVWLTNAPAAVIACYLLALVAMVAAVVERAWWPVWRAAIALAAGLMAAGFYIVPAAYEQRWIQIAQATSIGMRVEDSWLFARHHGADMALHDQILRVASLMMVVLVGLSLIGFVVAWKRRLLEQVSRRGLVVLATLPALVLLLQFPVTGFLWQHMPKLEYLQFPWRLMMVVEAPLGIFLAAASVCRRRWTRVIVRGAWAVIFLGTTLLSGLVFYQVCDEDDSIGGQIASINSGAGVEGTDEYTPIGGDNTLVATSLPDGCLVSDPAAILGEGAEDMTPAWDPEQGTCDASYKAALWQPEHKRLRAEAEEDGWLVLRLRNYPAWRVTVNGKPVENFAKRDDGLMAIPVSEGTNEVAIDWTTTRDVIWGRAITLAGLFLLAVVLWIESRNSSKSASDSIKMKSDVS
jgi:hypothetical protein